MLSGTSENEPTVEFKDRMMITTGQMVGLESVAKNALNYLLEYSTQEGVIALTAQLLNLQVQVMQGVKDRAEQKRMEAEDRAWGVIAAPTQKLPKEEVMQHMMRDQQMYQSRMMQNSVGWGVQNEKTEEKNDTEG